MNRKLLAATAVALAGLAAPSWASSITHSFDVVLSGLGSPRDGTYSGTFSYDSSTVPTGGGTLNQAGLLTAFSFTLLGINYDNQANTGALSFDSAGNLIDAVFGTNCFAGSCQATLGNWNFTWGSTGSNSTGFLGNNIGIGPNNIAGPFTGATSVSAVPEPGTLSLVVPGLAVIGLVLSRRRRAA